jgi:hypothetical protein
MPPLSAPAPAAARCCNTRRVASARAAPRRAPHAHTHAPHPPRAAPATHVAACAAMPAKQRRARAQRVRCAAAARSLSGARARGASSEKGLSRAYGGDVQLRSGEVVDVVLSSGFLAFAYHAGFLAAVEDAGAAARGARRRAQTPAPHVFV